MLAITIVVVVHLFKKYLQCLLSAENFYRFAGIEAKISPCPQEANYIGEDI